MNSTDKRELTRLANLLRRSTPRVLHGHRSVKQALGLSDEQIYAWAGMACQLAEQGNYQDARALLESLAVVDPDNAFVHNCLGTLYMRLDEADRAAGELLFALGREPHDISALVNLGELYLEAGDRAAAARYLTRAIELDKDQKAPHAQRARALMLLLGEK